MTVEYAIPKPETRLKRPFFTERQVEVLQLMIDRFGEKQIADKMGVSYHTIEKHKMDMLERLEDYGEHPTLYRAVVLAVVAGLVKVDNLPDKPERKLTERESEVLGLRIKGLNKREICQRLFVSPKTLEAHFAHIRHKFRVTNQYTVVATVAKMALKVINHTNDGSALQKI